MADKLKYYSLKNILKKDALYNVIFGERSNGKTFSVLKYCLEEYFKTGGELAIIRRWDEDFIGATSMRTCYNSLMCDGNGVNNIKKISNGEYDGIVYYSGIYYLSKKDESTGKMLRTDEIVARAFSINSQEHYKGSSFPNIKYILFDEFMTRKYYLVDEWTQYCNLLSTIIRQRDDVKIFMCANTITKYGCPYFTEMGLTHIKQMKQGDIDLYNYGDSGLVVAVEYSGGIAKNKASNIYFAFDSPHLKMITQGAWEMDIYPHCPVKYQPKDILFTYFIQFDEQTLQCEIIQHEDLLFTFIHRKTSELKNTEEDIIYQVDYSPRANILRKLNKPTSKIEQKIWSFFTKDKVFYQDNEIGEIVNSYLKWCIKTS